MPVSEAILHPLSMSPPLADRRDHVLVLHGDERQDPYYWLRDDSRQDPAVLDYLRAENEYTRQVLAPLQGLQKRLYREMRGRQKPDDSSLPYFYRGYWYVTRYEAEAEFPCYDRHPGALQAPAERLLDAQDRASTSDFYELGSLEISPDERYLAVSEDWISRRQYRIQIRDLQTGLWLPDVLESCSSELVWAADSRSFFYVRLDDETLLPYQVWNHVLGEPGHRDRLIYEEVDDSYYLSLEQSRSEQLLLISLHSTLSSEVWWLPLTDIEDEPVCFLPRRRGHEYQLDHFADHIYIRSNYQGANFGLYRTLLAVEPVQRESDWHCLLAPRQEVLLQQFELFRSAILLEERQAGLAVCGSWI